MKDFITFFIGSMILCPVVICLLSASFIGTVIGVVYLLTVIYTSRFFPKFWVRWWRVNLRYVEMIEDLGKYEK